MTNTIVLLSVLLQTNWADTTVMNGGMQIQVGRVMTNYVIRPATVFTNKKRADVIEILPTPANKNAPASIEYGRAYPILTSQPFYGPYNLVREVIPPNVYFYTNNTHWWRGFIQTNEIFGWILTNGSFWPRTNKPQNYTLPLP